MDDLLTPYFQELDPNFSGMYVIRLNERVTDAQFEGVVKHLNKTIQLYNPECTVLVLPSVFDSIAVLDEAAMNKRGWFKKEDLPSSEND